MVLRRGGVALAHHFSYHTALAHHREAASLRFTNLCNANLPWVWKIARAQIKGSSTTKKWC